jgi:glucosamine--fructose-6-phosphate aminotransferase (isomerizing)
MTFFLKDILRQPGELQRTLDFLCGPGSEAVARAASALRDAREIYLTGMGSSWHAALNASYICHRNGLPAHTLDACDLLELACLPAGSVLVIISRSGRSVELEPLIEVARRAGATVIGLTNNAASPLALLSHISMVVPVTPDHAISVNTFSTLALAAAALANAACGRFDTTVVAALEVALRQVAGLLPTWQKQVAASAWLAPHSTCYFLARRSSFGSAQEARLMWEEGVKAPATAMGTGSFRHGPQEIITPEVRFCLWIDAMYMREQDLAVVRDLKRLGAQVMLIGQNVPEDAADLTFQLPEVAQEWQFLLDVIPAQLVAERLAGLSGVNCDVFRYCSFIVEDDHGLTASK